MRIAFTALFLLAVVPPALGKRTPPERPWPAPGLYCPVGADVFPILVERPGTIGIDGLDCQSARWDGGRVTARRCYANGGFPGHLGRRARGAPNGPDTPRRGAIPPLYRAAPMPPIRPSMSSREPYKIFDFGEVSLSAEQLLAVKPHRLDFIVRSGLAANDVSIFLRLYVVTLNELAGMLPSLFR